MDSDSQTRPEFTGPLARAAYRSGYVYAILSALLGLVGVAGEISGLTRLAQPLPDWPATPLLASIALLAIGVALWEFLERRYRSAFVASMIAVVTALLSLVVEASIPSVTRYAMPLAAQVLTVAAASPLAIVSARRKLVPEDVSVGIAGFVLLALAATLIIARATGVTDTTLDVLGAGPSLQMLVVSFLIGTCYVALVWTRGLVSGDSAQWLPAALGIALLVTVTVLWRGLAARENEQVVALTRQAGDEQRRVLQREAEVTAHSLQRAGEWHVAGATPEQQQRDADALRRDVPGLEGVGWIGTSGVVDTTASVSLGMGVDSATVASIGRIGFTDTIAYLPLDTAVRRFAVIAPACDRAGCAGRILGTIRTIDFFGSIMPDTTRGFGYAIVGPAGTLAGSPTWTGGLPRWTQRLPLQLGAMRLSVAASPTPGTVDRVRSSLPVLVLLMGFVVSGLVPVSVLFAQRSLRNAREAERVRITAALDRTTDGIWEWDLLTGTSVHSPGIWRYLGYDPDTISPKRDAWLSLVHPEDYPRLARELTDHLTGARSSFDAEYRVRARDATWHTIVDRGRVVDRTPNGRPARMVGIKADVTVARSAQQAREAAEQRFREIFDSGFQYQLLLDHAGTVVEVNQHALDECAVTSDQVRGRPVWETLWWTGNAEAQDRLHAATSDALHGLTRRYEDEIRGPGATSVHLEIAVKPLTGDGGTPTQLLLEARDLTARRRAEATLREVETLTTMGRVAAQVAHEINNPLAGIQNAFLLIKGAIPTTHPHYAYVGAIEREIARIAAVTRQLYETYRPEHESSGGAAIATVLGDAVAFLEQVNRPSGVRVQMELGGGPSVIPFPTALLRQIAYNLVQNAIEASPPAGVVVVRTTASDGHFELRVRDRGPGVSPEVRERIFEPFFSTKSGRLRTGGMGLGLALVRRTVTAAGGTIAVEDVDGGGCDFVVTLPLDTNEEGS